MLLLLLLLVRPHIQHLSLQLVELLLPLQPQLLLCLQMWTQLLQRHACQRQQLLCMHGQEVGRPQVWPAEMPAGHRHPAA